ncbi:MAG: asparagine synthase (glutamine-hydrolyzing) [Thiogranum sp.]|nr:asparagine synthase (glutamine-hydrolyzing) [Thiogranum sp.]
MCGIAFCYSRNGSDTIRGKVGAALDKLAHRGPDAAGIHVAGNAVSGHRRLSIIDLEHSRQPMVSPCGRYTLSFNGEIYNFRTLRPTLDQQWQFTTQGDTEVLLAGLVTEGLAFVDRLEGMWAFSFWDNTTETLYLSRDRIGKKPLYYQISEGGIAAASELPALRLMAPAAWNEDADSTADYLRYGFYLPGHTAYCEVLEVLPGHHLTWSPGQGAVQTRYWRIDPQAAAERNSDTGALISALTSAVEKRLVADVEVGAFLSGGVDSSLIVALLRQSGVHPKTFTIGFEDQAYDERRYASQVAAHLQTEHYEQVLGGWDVQRLFTLLKEHVGQPFSDSSLLPTALVSALAAQHVKVVLSGDGADELFSGYQRYQASTLLRWYSRLPGALRHNIPKLVRSLPEPMAHHSRSLLKKAHLFVDLAEAHDDTTPYIAPALYSPAQFADFAPGLIQHGHQPPGIPAQTAPDDIGRMMLADALVYLPQDILAKVDRASMACSLEARTPFLDTRVIELAFSQPGNSHRNSLHGKRLLHAAFADLLPANIWRRRKQGFSVPIHDWFRGAMGEDLEQLLATLVLPFNVRVVSDLLKEHRAYRRDHGHRLWNLYNYCVWKSGA